MQEKIGREAQLVATLNGNPGRSIITLRLVQFMHPGGQPPHRGRGIKPWNAGGHCRSFLLAPGSFRTSIAGASQQAPRLGFWGEWEGPAEGIPLDVVGAAHTAFIPRPEAFPASLGLQNTDPFVFDGPFLYSCCKQVRYDGVPTYLRNLDRGDVLLFGSNLAGSFVLDTVFVVADGIPYTRRTGPQQLGGLVPCSFMEATLKPLAFLDRNAASDQVASGCSPDGWDADDERTWCGPVGSLPDVEYRLYRGATPEAPVNGMFSFVPVRVASDALLSFDRPVPENYVSPALNTGSRQCLRGPESAHLVSDAWSYVVKVVINAGLMLGTSFRSSESDATYA